MSPIAVILASASPRRRILLERAGFQVRVEVPPVDESALPGESPEDLARRLAERKAEAVASARGAHGEIVVAGDTVVLLDRSILGKPGTSPRAARMLRALSGRSHDVLGGWCVRRGERIRAGIERTAVRFRVLSDAEIDAYVATGEPLDKAGGYGIQGGGRAFVESITGSWENVVGLPIDRVRAAIRELAAGG